MTGGGMGEDFDFGAVAEAYERYAEPLTLSFSEGALDLLGIGPGSSVIDVACGPGGAAVAAARRGARVLAVDGAPAMAARAAERLGAHPGCGARAMDCAALDAADGAFDAALSLFGVLILPVWRAGLAELARVVRPGGRVAASAWADPEGPRSAVLLKAAFDESFPGRALWPNDPVIWTEAALRGAMAEAGLVDVGIHRQDGAVSAASVDEMVEQGRALFRFVPGYAALAEPDRARVLAGYADRLGPCAAADGSVRLPMPAFIATGTRP